MTKDKLLAMPADDYMNAEQHAFFTELLQNMKVETHERIEQNRIAIESLDTPADPADAHGHHDPAPRPVRSGPRGWIDRARRPHRFKRAIGKLSHSRASRSAGCGGGRVPCSPASQCPEHG